MSVRELVNLYQGCAMLRMTTRVKLGDYLTMKAAAALLGICPGKLRNSDRAGKPKPVHQVKAGSVV
jgi:hypothetical protein